MRQTSIALAADQFDLGLLNTPGLSDDPKSALQKKMEGYRKTVARYVSEPETNEGKKELIQRAKPHEVLRDHAL